MRPSLLSYQLWSTQYIQSIDWISYIMDIEIGKSIKPRFRDGQLSYSRSQLSLSVEIFLDKSNTVYRYEPHRPPWLYLIDISNLVKLQSIGTYHTRQQSWPTGQAFKSLISQLNLSLTGLWRKHNHFLHNPIISFRQIYHFSLITVITLTIKCPDWTGLSRWRTSGS